MMGAPGSPVIPFSVATAGIATFALMDVLMKGLAIELGAYNAMLWRTSIALVLAAALFLVKKRPWPAGGTIRLHVWRGVVTSLMAFLFFWGLVFVPLAEAIALSFIAPLVAMYFAAVLLQEKVGTHGVVASLVGFAGAMVIVAGRFNAGYSDEMLYGIVAILLSALLYAYNLILQRQQALLARPFEIAFFQNAAVVGVYLLFAPFFAVIPNSAQVPALSVAALLGIISLLLLSWAYARAEAKILIPVEYTAFVWAALFGWFVFAEALTAVTLAGTALIVFGCLIATRQQRAPINHIETTVV